MTLTENAASSWRGVFLITRRQSISTAWKPTAETCRSVISSSMTQFRYLVKTRASSCRLGTYRLIDAVTSEGVSWNRKKEVVAEQSLRHHSVWPGVYTSGLFLLTADEARFSLLSGDCVVPLERWGVLSCWSDGLSCLSNGTGSSEKSPPFRRNLIYPTVCDRFLGCSFPATPCAYFLFSYINLA